MFVYINQFYFSCLVDTDECELEQCPENANCVNTPGSFSCNCNPGFVADGANSCTGIPRNLIFLPLSLFILDRDDEIDKNVFQELLIFMSHLHL